MDELTLIEELAAARAQLKPAPPSLEECQRVLESLKSSKLVDKATHVRCYEFLIHCASQPIPVVTIVERSGADRRKGLPAPEHEAIIARAAGDRRAPPPAELRKGERRHGEGIRRGFDTSDRRKGKDRRKG